MRRIHDLPASPRLGISATPEQEAEMSGFNKRQGCAVPGAS
jgi:hypothetical protein